MGGVDVYGARPSLLVQTPPSVGGVAAGEGV